MPTLESKNFLKNIAVLRKFFIKKTRVQPLVGEPTLTKEQIYKKFRRARTILRIVFTLNKISEEIIVYGTSSNLFDLSIRDRQALKRYLFPLLYQEQDDLFQDLVEFPLIHPNSLVKTVWNPILFFLMVYTATLLPYRMAFEPDLMTPGWFIFDIIIDVLFWLDFIINCISAYFDDEGKLIKTRKEVIVNYLRTWFFVDLVACLPMEQIFIGIFGSEGESDKVISLPPLPP